MRVLIACEYSGRVREAFRRLGHDAWSCDLLESEDGSPYHIQRDVLSMLGGHYFSERVEITDAAKMRAREMLERLEVRAELSQAATHYQAGVFGSWDLMIAHPPCTHLAVSGARHFAAKQEDGRQQEAIDFFLALARAPIPRIAIENPVCIMSSVWRKPDQTIQPWMFGHGETKATCLWLKGLPHLVPTNIVSGRHPRVHLMPPGPDRWKERSRTYEGIANAMAAQWGGYADLVTLMEAA
jgi:hypothetical protein